VRRILAAMPRPCLAALLCVLGACTGETARLRINLGISGDQRAEFDASVRSIEVRLESRGSTLATVRLDNQREVGAPGLPFASPLDVTVRGLAGDLPLFFGRRADVLVSPTGESAVTVLVRRLNDFADSLGAAPRSRWKHTATRLLDGRVLVAGGEDPATGNALDAVELFDPRTGLFTAAGSLRHARAEHAAALLGDGRVVIAGGLAGSGFVRFVEIFDPATGSFSEAGELTLDRAGLTATVYRSAAGERVLLAGGRGPAGAQDSAELYNPALRSVSQTRAMIAPRAGHAALPVGDAILLVGGHPSSLAGELFRTGVERFFRTAGSLAAARPRAARARTDAGRIVVAGSGNLLEVFDPAAEQFRTLPATLAAPREIVAMAALPGDALLVVGGGSEGNAVATAEILEGDSVSATDRPLGAPRIWHTATRLLDGTVLVVGGAAGAPAEVFLKN
jgi:hypothetical protein